MKTFYKGTSAVILTYDITSEKSYGDLDYWYKQISNPHSIRRRVQQERSRYHAGGQQVRHGVEKIDIQAEGTVIRLEE